MYSSEWNLKYDVGCKKCRSLYSRNSPIHVRPIGDVWSVHLHLLVQPVIEDERMGHCQSLGLHGMEGPVVEVSHVRVVKVSHSGPRVT